MSSLTQMPLKGAFLCSKAKSWRSSTSLFLLSSMSRLISSASALNPGFSMALEKMMLRRIFDDAQARQSTLSEPEQDDDFSAPFAVDKSENVEEPASGLEADPAEGTAELSRFGADELLHYRQQMYRTDI